MISQIWKWRSRVLVRRAQGPVLWTSIPVQFPLTGRSGSRRSILYLQEILETSKIALLFLKSRTLNPGHYTIEHICDRLRAWEWVFSLGWMSHTEEKGPCPLSRVANASPPPYVRQSLTSDSLLRQTVSYHLTKRSFHLQLKQLQTVGKKIPVSQPLPPNTRLGTWVFVTQWCTQSLCNHTGDEIWKHQDSHVAYF